MDLTEFLLARIAEDEAIALEASWRFTEHSGSESVAEHIARHDPTRVLAECDAKQRIVRLYGPLQFSEGTGVPIGGEGPEVYWDAVRLLALPYAEHPDYRADWRP